MLTPQSGSTSLLVTTLTCFLILCSSQKDAAFMAPMEDALDHDTFLLTSLAANALRLQMTLDSVLEEMKSMKKVSFNQPWQTGQALTSLCDCLQQLQVQLFWQP